MSQKEELDEPMILVRKLIFERRNLIKSILLTQSELLTLREIKNIKHPCTSTEVAAVMEKTIPAVAFTLNRLVDKGYLLTEDAEGFLPGRSKYLYRSVV